jgi:hypothetical protein
MRILGLVGVRRIKGIRTTIPEAFLVPEPFVDGVQGQD